MTPSTLREQRERVARELCLAEKHDGSFCFSCKALSEKLGGLMRAAIVATAEELGYIIDENGKCRMSLCGVKMFPDPLALLDEGPGRG